MEAYGVAVEVADDAFAIPEEPALLAQLHEHYNLVALVKSIVISLKASYKLLITDFEEHEVVCTLGHAVLYRDATPDATLAREPCPTRQVWRVHS